MLQQGLKSGASELKMFELVTYDQGLCGRSSGGQGLAVQEWDPEQMLQDHGWSFVAPRKYFGTPKNKAEAGDLKPWPTPSGPHKETRKEREDSVAPQAEWDNLPWPAWCNQHIVKVLTDEPSQVNTFQAFRILNVKLY